MEPQSATVKKATATKAENPTATVEEEPLVEEELLVEQVSIDGMCGVY